jgi:transketolase
LLQKEGIATRVVSMPSWELFLAQPPAYQESVLPTSVRARVSVEAASPFGWDRFVGPFGKTVAMTTFGASAPIDDLLAHFGFTPERVALAVRDSLKLVDATQS